MSLAKLEIVVAQLVWSWAEGYNIKKKWLRIKAKKISLRFI
jgi:hypothetical protein